MNYYIQGDAAKADKINAAFEKLGYDTSSYLFNSKSVLYFTLDGEIMATTCYCTPAIIKTHPDYKELELPVEHNFNFKIGDWIVRGRGFVYEPSLITEIRDYYICELLNGERVTYTLNDVHKNFHLWTIADAKDGDVLSYQDEIFIARIDRGLSANVAIDYDCCYDGNSFILDSFYSLTVEELKKVYPATKEQRDLLFKKMKEAGYTWNEKTKELKKIVKSQFKAEDWLVYKDGCTFCGDLKTVQVQTVEKDRYTFTHGTKSAQRFIDSECRLWTIQDAKDGDILATDGIICIFKKLDKDGYYIISPCIYTVKDGLEVIDDEEDSIGSYGFRPATKEDRELLFRKMKEAGYQWDVDKKELRKIQPHYDIANFQPFDKVLVRDGDMEYWNTDLFSSYYDEFHCFRGSWEQCIPFNEETKHLLGTTDMPDERFINW